MNGYSRGRFFLGEFPFGGFLSRACGEVGASQEVKEFLEEIFSLMNLLRDMVHYCS